MLIVVVYMFLFYSLRTWWRYRLFKDPSIPDLRTVAMMEQMDNIWYEKPR
jgi:hypothetical protein